MFGGTLGAEGLPVCVKGAFRSWGSPVCVGRLSASTEGPVGVRGSVVQGRCLQLVCVRRLVTVRSPICVRGPVCM